MTFWWCQVYTFHDGCKQGIDQQIFNRKSISRKITHPQSWKLQAKLTGEKLKGWSNSREKTMLLLQPFSFSPVSFACNFQDRGCVMLREIDFLLKICWSIPCLHPSWKVHTWIKICGSLNHCKKTKADGSRLIPRKHTETLVLLSVFFALRHATRPNLRLPAIIAPPDQLPPEYRQ